MQAIREIEWRSFDANGKPALELKFSVNGQVFTVGVLIRNGNVDAAKGECRDGVVAKAAILERGGIA